jgi:hypothetical protein
MRRLVLAAAIVAAGILTASNALAAGWSLLIDAPVSYTFNSSDANTPTTPSNLVSWQNPTTQTVSGSAALLITPIHIGFGYEDYSVQNKITFPTGGNGTGTGLISTNLRFYDIALDLPMKHLNLTFGYGQGTADTDFVPLTGGSQGTPTPIRNATASQYFLLVGIPLGQTFDLHVGYHWVTIAPKDLASSSGTNGQTKFDGQMLSAGLRFNF